MKGWTTKKALLEAAKRPHRREYRLKKYNVGVPCIIFPNTLSKTRNNIMVKVEGMSAIVAVESISFTHKLFKNSIPFECYTLVKELEKQIKENCAKS